MLFETQKTLHKTTITSIMAFQSIIIINYLEVILEITQAGLSWETVLKKKPHFE